ncbi:MAG: hypothetical protein OSJ43_06810 [Oscillospiraceae bacterium]|nr:hypothetical protein [Oscillospiraceae bacterium]
MNNNLGKALLDVGKAKGVAAAIESAYLTIDVAPYELERADNAVNAFYALQDIINEISDDINALADNREKGK